MTHTRSIERNLLLLAGAALTLFLTLVSALFVVQGSMGRQEERFEQIIVPVQQSVAEIETAIAVAFAREADISSTRSTADLERLRDRSPIERGLGAADARLDARLGRVRDAGLAKRAEAMNETIALFLRGDAALFDSVMKGHGLDATFREGLDARGAELKDEAVRVQGIAGRARLSSVLLLRRLATGGGGTSELLFGDVRARRDSAQDLQQSLQRYAMLVALLGTTRDADALNSMVANELPQARSRVAEDLADLADLQSSDADFASGVASLRADFDRVASRVADLADPASLVSLRYATFSERARAAGIRQDCGATAQRLLGDARDVERSADDLAESAARTSSALERSARVASILLTVLGLGICAFSARRIVESVAQLRATNARLVALQDELVSLNRGLEQTVDERTRSLREREQSLQLVLDATGDGLVRADAGGGLLGERSRAVDDWFGPSAPGVRLWDVLYPGDPRRAMSFELAWTQLVSDDLPMDLSLDQMPRDVERAGRTLQLDFKPVRAGPDITSVLVVIEDVTARRAAERAEAEARAVQTVLANVLKDPAGFRRGIAELASLAAEVREGDDPIAVRRALHTLKGNAALMGFAELAARCHALEQELVDGGPGRTPSADGCRAIDQALRDAVISVDALVGRENLDRLQISLDELSELVRLLDARRPHDEIVDLVRRWSLEPLAGPLRMLASQASRLAERMNKPLTVDVIDRGLRADPDLVAPICSHLVHAVRNAVDHGIEDAAIRAERDKPVEGHLVLSASPGEEGSIVLEVADDGNGIDFDALRAVARARGIPAETHQDLVDALFADGVSTRVVATEVSGRGVGMAALRQACERVGATLSVTSIPTRGTSLRIQIPAQSPGEAAGDASQARLIAASRDQPSWGPAFLGGIAP